MMKFDNFIDTAVLGMDTTNNVLLHLLMMSTPDIKQVVGIRIDNKKIFNDDDDAIAFKADNHLFILHNDGLVSVVTAFGSDGNPLDREMPIITAVKTVGDITFRMGINDFADFPNLHKAVQKLVDLIDDKDVDVWFEVDDFDDIEITK